MTSMWGFTRLVRRPALVLLGTLLGYVASGCIHFLNCDEIIETWTPATYVIADSMLPGLDGGTVELTDDGLMVIRYLDANGVETTVIYEE